MRTPIIAANWKMNNTLPQARALVTAEREALAQLAATGKVEIVLCPPFTALALTHELVAGTRIGVAAQNLYWEAKGAFTGEIAPGMVAELAQYVIIGHSERRQFFGETDATVNKKVHAALANQLTPIVCVGESLQQYEAGETNKVIDSQVKGALAGLARENAAKLVIAYEPIWAIGTGKAATAAGANAVIGLTIRGALVDLFDEELAQTVRVQYGGSVNAKNIAEFLVQPDIDGALVGGASLVAQDFIAICQAAAK